MQPLVLSAFSTVTAAGIGAGALLDGLRRRTRNLAPNIFAGDDTGLEGGTAGGRAAGYVGLVPECDWHPLPNSLARFDCRNNRLADLALHADGFCEALAAAADRYGPGRIAVVLGTSTSGILSTEEAYRRRDRVTGALPPDLDYGKTHDLYSLARFVRAALGLRGPALTVSTACASSARCFVDAAHLIEAGLCDAAVVGGADSLCRMTLNGFAALDLISPEPCRPCDADRGGISIGEAAGFALLERPGAARIAGGRPVALLGYGSTSDGYHMSSPDPGGAGAIAAMEQALACGGLAAGDIDYVNLHGTGTRANDAMEDVAVSHVFADETPCSSTKGWTGHTLGASGIVEAVIAVLAIREGLLPGCIGVRTLDPGFRSRVLVENEERPTRRVMSNSFGFGGINCSLVFGALDG